VMSVCLSVSLSVCLSVREHIFTRSLPIFVLAVSYGRSSVLVRQGDKMPIGSGIFGVFLPIDNAL